MPSETRSLFASFLGEVTRSTSDAGMTDEALCEMAASAVRQWIGLFSGLVPPHLVNPGGPAFCERFEAEFSFKPASPPNDRRADDVVELFRPEYSCVSAGNHTASPASGMLVEAALEQGQMLQQIGLRGG
jgi:hypothetical protein